MPFFSDAPLAAAEGRRVNHHNQSTATILQCLDRPIEMHLTGENWG